MAPELSYWKALNPQVLGSAEAETAKPIASASARVILVNMVDLLVWKPKRLLPT